MVKLDFNTYKDKVMGCWAGKNAGGVFGAPFECLRQYNDIDFYTQDLSDGPPPNDDLDLQIVWLNAVERYGRQVDASILAEYWLSYIIPHWGEYGVARSGLVAGLKPPLSGSFRNQYKDSNGCFIRSEIWACLAPGLPEIAVRYAYEDAIIDHSGEGMYGEIFCAALESAAFVESDIRKLIDIGLSYIPNDSAVARCINKAVECYDKKLDIKEARVLIHNEAPGTFGIIGKTTIEKDPDGMEVGEPGFDAPENVGFTIAGLLYGEGDFGKSLHYAVACGEDGDCTAATLGAIIGIIAGAKALPKKWLDPLDDKIKTLCINLTTFGGLWVPNTVTELTDRILRVTPKFHELHDIDLLAEGGYAINCRSGADLYCPDANCPKGHHAGWYLRGYPTKELIALSPNAVRHNYLSHVVVIDYGDDIFFDSKETRKFKVIVINKDILHQQMWCKLKIYTHEDVILPSGAGFSLQLTTFYGDKAEAEIEVDASQFMGGKLELLIDIAFEGRHTNTPVKATFLRRYN